MTRITVAVIDDESVVRDSLREILATYDIQVSAYASVEDFLCDQNASPDCILLDVMMPGVDGMDGLTPILARSPDVPVIMMTGHGSVRMAVSAMKHGAKDFVEKPLDDIYLHALIAQHAGVAKEQRDASVYRDTVNARLDRLTERERTVLTFVVKGHTSMSIASNLGISKKTVDHHRASIQAKMAATSVVQLIRMILEVRPELAA